MRYGKNVLNNMMMDVQRKTPLYQTVITDLAIVGAISKDKAKELLGYEIPAYLNVNGKNIDGNEVNKKTNTVISKLQNAVKELNTSKQGKAAEVKDEEVDEEEDDE